MKTEINADVLAALEAVSARKIDHVFLVACGGSLSIMHAGKYMLDRFFTTLSSDLYNGDEFVLRDPRKLGENALVILCSQTGTTRETVRAANHAKSKGAITIGMTLDGTSPLATAADHVVAYQASYTTGVPIDAADSNYGVLYMLLVGLLRIVSGEDRVTALLSSLSHLQPAIDKAHDQFADKFAAYAAAFRAKDTIYTLASGAAYGAAYSFAICVFMEMLWINSQAIHANEFFHGPFEVVDKDAAFVVLVGLDETRPLAQRAETFLQRFGASQNILVLDAADLDLAGITPEFQSFLVPLIFFDTLWRFAYRLADIRGKVMLEDRRYMKKLTDY